MMNDYSVSVERTDDCEGFWLSVETGGIYVDDSVLHDLIQTLQEQYREYIG